MRRRRRRKKRRKRRRRRQKETRISQVKEVAGQNARGRDRHETPAHVHEPVTASALRKWR